MFGFVRFKYHYCDRKFPYVSEESISIALYINVRKSMDLRQSCSKILLVIKSYSGSIIWFLIFAGVLGFIHNDIGRGLFIKL